jgi:hypothetical protein
MWKKSHSFRQLLRDAQGIPARLPTPTANPDAGISKNAANVSEVDREPALAADELVTLWAEAHH